MWASKHDKQQLWHDRRATNSVVYEGLIFVLFEIKKIKEMFWEEDSIDAIPLCSPKTDAMERVEGPKESVSATQVSNVWNVPMPFIHMNA